MTDINQCNLSGTVIAKEDGDVKGTPFSILHLHQTVAGQFETTFICMLACENEVKTGDEILILNATVYEKDGNFRFRVAEKSNIKIIKPKLNLGLINAQDKFI